LEEVFEETITVELYRELVEGLLQKCRQTLDKVFRNSKGVTKEDITHISMVGGGTRLKQV